MHPKVQKLLQLVEDEDWGCTAKPMRCPNCGGASRKSIGFHQFGAKVKLANEEYTLLACWKGFVRQQEVECKHIWIRQTKRIKIISGEKFLGHIHEEDLQTFIKEVNKIKPKVLRVVRQFI